MNVEATLFDVEIFEKKPRVSSSLRHDSPCGVLKCTNVRVGIVLDQRVNIQSRTAVLLCLEQQLEPQDTGWERTNIDCIKC